MAESVELALGLGVMPTQDAIRGQITTDEKTGKLKQPENIIRTLYGARAVFFKHRAEHLKRIHLYAAIRGMFSGNPPYDPAELAKHGLGWVSNFNDLNARSKLDKGAEALWNLLNEVEYLMNFQIRYPKEKNLAPQLEEYQDSLAAHADDILREWRSFNTVQNTMSMQLMELGVSPVFWHDPEDWHYRTVELSKFYVADQTLTDMDRLSSVCVESFFDVQWLFQAYERAVKDTKNGANPTASPWNVEELKYLLLRQANTYYKAQGLPYNEMDMQRKMESGDLLWESAFTDNIRLVSLFYKEYDGKISHYMFHQTVGQKDCLFFSDRLYNSFDEALVIFTASPGEFTIHSNRGLGHKMFALSQAINQMHCSLVDAGRLAATVLLRSSPMIGADAAPIRLYPGGITHIGTAEVVESQIGENVNQLVGLAQYFDGMTQRNLMNAGDDPAVPDADKGSVSSSQARMMAFKEFGVLRNVVNHYYNTQDWVYQNVLRIWLKCLSGNHVTWPAYKDAKRWRDRCINDGVPKEIFEWDTEENEPRHLQVTASRVAGDGSTLARIMSLEAMQGIIGALGPDGVYEWQRQWVMATVGKHHVRAFLPSKAQYQAQTGGSSVAGVENAVAQLGQSPVMGLGDDHIAHITTHLTLASDILKKLTQKQLQPIDADKVLAVMTPHIVEHQQAAARNPFNKGTLEKLKAGVGQVVKLTQMNRQNATKQLQAQLQEQQQQKQDTQTTMTDEQRKDMVAQGDIRRADEKVKSQVARASEANRTRADVMRTKVERDAENKRLEIQLKHQAETSANASAQLESMAGSTPAPTDVEMTQAPEIPPPTPLPNMTGRGTLI